MISSFKQENISSAHIMVVGCGALGNEVLKNLVLSGVGHITIVDFDLVEPDNLFHSILFSQEDAQAGRLKVDAAATRLKALNPAVKVTPLCGDIAYDVGLGRIREQQLLIGCVDNRWARYCINRLCMRAGIPWVDGGIDGLEGTVRVFAPGKNCYACNLGPEGMRDLSYRMPCPGAIRRNLAAGKVPTTSITSSIIGAVEVQEALKLLHPESLADGSTTSMLGSMFCYEGEHLTTRMVSFKAYDADCAVHEQWAPVIMSPLSSQCRVSDLLSWIRQETSAREVNIQLPSDCFVDDVILRSDDTSVSVMKAGRHVAAFIEQDALLAGIPLSSLYQHEYREIDATFPYQDLTLAGIGIADREVLPVMADGRDYYFELSKA